MNEEYILPNGWRQTELGATISSITNGIVAEQNFERKGFPVTRIETISNGIIDQDKLGWVNPTVKDLERFKLHNDDILFSHINSVERLGNCAIYEGFPGNLYHGMNLLRIQVDKSQLEPRFLLYWLRSEYCRDFYVTNARRAIGQASLNQKDLRRLPITLPTLAVQRRIVSKLQELMQEVGHARTACEKQLEAAKALPAAHLREAFESEEAKRWDKKRLGEVCDLLNGFAFDSDRFSTAEGMPLIRIRDLTTNEPSTKYTGDFNPRYLVQPGALLVGMDGEFRCHEWNGPVALLNQRVCRLIPHPGELDRGFLLCSLNKYLEEIEGKTAYTTVKHISSRQILAISLPVAPLPVQRRIAAEVRQKRAEASELLSSIINQTEAIGTLPEAILRKAFRGEL